MSLAKRSITSSAYNVGANIIQTGILALRSIFLARLLSPDDFGVYAFVGSIIVITNALPNFGMSAAFVHRAKESEGEDALRVYFSLSFIFNLVWGVVIAILGIFILTGESRLILWTILTTQIVINLTNVGKAKLIKKIVFRRIALVETMIVVVTTLIALWLAYRGYGVWSLVSTDIVTALILVFGFYVFRPIWRPGFGWASTTVRYFLDFGKRTFFAGILGQALDRIDDFWTGFFLGESSLGFYSRAYTFATYPRKILAGPINAVAGGTYAELKDDPERLSKAFFRVNAFLVRTGFLFGAVLALIAPEFIHLVIGDKWLPMLTAFRLMLIYTMIEPIRQTVAGLFTAIGIPEIVTKIRLVQLIVLIVGLFAFGFSWGISGVAIAVNLMSVVGIFFLLRQARDYVNFSPFELFVAPTVAVFMSLVITWSAAVGLSDSFSYLGSMIFKITSVSMIYFILLYLLERERLLEVLEMLKRNFA